MSGVQVIDRNRKRLAGRTPNVKRGRPPSDKTREERAGLLQAAAVALVVDRGVEALSFRALAVMPAVNLTHAAAVHYFGSAVGLLGAVAEQGFTELRDAIYKARSSRGAKRSLHLRLALAHARFALDRKNLYRAIHSPQLWQYTRGTELRDAAKTKEAYWVERAIAARDYGFHEYVVRRNG